MRKKEFIWLSITRSVYSGHQLARGEPVMARFRAPPIGLEEGGGGVVALLFTEGEERAMIREGWHWRERK